MPRVCAGDNGLLLSVHPPATLLITPQGKAGGGWAVSPANLPRTGLSYSHQRFSDQAEAEEQAVQVCRHSDNYRDSEGRV